MDTTICNLYQIIAYDNCIYGCYEDSIFPINPDTYYRSIESAQKDFIDAINRYVDRDCVIEKVTPINAELKWKYGDIKLNIVEVSVYII